MNSIYKLVLFGAGKIGRSFIAQLFSRGGFEVVFVDVNVEVINELNKRGNYNLVVKSDIDKVINIKNVRGVLASERQKVINEIASARIMAVSVGLNAMTSVIPLIAEGLLKRFEADKESPLDIILAENLRDAAQFMHKGLKCKLPNWYPIDKLVGLVETSIGKMVPMMLKKEMEEDILQVFAEPYNTLILDKLAFKSPIPDIQGLAPKENMKAWVDRKLFIHNLGHAATAYLGYLHDPGFIFLYEALAIPQLKEKISEIMLQSAQILMAKYPGEFTIDQLADHIDDLIFRFQNKALGDTIFRVGCDLPRKLSPEDRLSGAIKLAKEMNLPYDKVLLVLVSACHFAAVNEEGNRLSVDAEFTELYMKKGLKFILTTVCGFDENTDQEILRKAIEIEN